MDFAKVRLANQHISGNKCKKAEDVVRSLGAVQAQDFSQALWAIGLRMERAGVADIETAFAERKIIRAWSMRGTLHFLLSEDAHWMRELFAPQVLVKITPKVWQYHAADEKMVELAKQVFIKALSGGKTLKRPQMVALLKEAGIPDDKQQSYFLFSYLCQTGLLCLGASEDGKQNFALLDEWLPKARHMAREESLGLLATRFFTSHGPATVADFANWSGLKVPDAVTGLELIKSKLVKEIMDNKEYWQTSSTKAGSGAFLLPGYDEFLIGYKDRSPVFKRGVVQISTYNGMFYPTIVVDGQVVGLWKRTVKKTQIDIEIDPGTPVEPVQVEAHAQQLGDFFGLPTRLRVGSKTRMKPSAPRKWGSAR